MPGLGGILGPEDKRQACLPAELAPSSHGGWARGPSQLGGDPARVLCTEEKADIQGLGKIPRVVGTSGTAAGVLGRLPPAWLCGLCSDPGGDDSPQDTLWSRTVALTLCGLQTAFYTL